MRQFRWTWRNFSKHHQNTRIWVFFSAYQPSEFFLRHFPRACDFTSIPSGKYNKNFVELSFSSEKSLFRIETNSERTILILPSFFFFCDFNIITKTSCGNTKDRNSFKRMLTCLFIRLYKNNPSHRIFKKKKKRLKLIKIDRASFKIFPRNQSRNQSITRIRHYSFSHKSLSNNSKIISIITSKYNKKKNLYYSYSV